MADLRIRGRIKEGTHTHTHTYAHMLPDFRRTRDLMPYTGHDRFKDECNIFREKFVFKVRREREGEKKTSCRTRDMTDLRMSVASSGRCSCFFFKI